MKFVSWNVNGLRAAREKGFDEIFKKFDADFFCLQEIKLQAGQINMNMDGYHSYWNYAEKKGYSGTAIFTKIEPINVFYGLGKEEHDKEGRLITLEYPDFYISTVYTPNSKQELLRLDYRQEWDPGFTDEEREKFTLLLDAGFTDTFRYFYPDKENEYSWWSYRANARKNNTGWRIDYFLVSDRLQEKLTAASIHQDVLGSDHCPVSVELSL